MGTAANYKVLHNHISAQLLLSKHRHSKKPTGAKSQPVTSQGYLQSKDIDMILSIYPFLSSTCRHEIRNDTNPSCQNNRGKVGKTVKFVHLWQGKGTKFMQIYQNPTNHWPIGMKQSCPSEFCTFRLKSKY